MLKNKSLLKNIISLLLPLMLLPNVAWAEDYSGYGVLLYAMAVLPFLPFNIVNLAIAWKFLKKNFGKELMAERTAIFCELAEDKVKALENEKEKLAATGESSSEQLLINEQLSSLQKSIDEAGKQSEIPEKLFAELANEKIKQLTVEILQIELLPEYEKKAHEQELLALNEKVNQLKSTLEHKKSATIDSKLILANLVLLVLCLVGPLIFCGLSDKIFLFMLLFLLVICFLSSIVIFIIAWRLLKKNSRRELLKLPAGSFDAEKDQAKILENKIQQLVSIAEDKELSELREQLETLKQKIRYRKFERICSVALIVNLVIVLLGYGFWIGFYLFII